MKETVESWTQQGNTCFLAGKNSDAIPYYYKALKKSGALNSVVKYVQKTKTTSRKTIRCYKNYSERNTTFILFTTPYPSSSLALKIK